MTTPMIRVLNPLLYSRTSTLQCVVPFPRGTVQDVAALTVVGSEACDLEAFGMRWPDGSVRFARVWARVTMGPGETRVFVVEPGVRPDDGPVKADYHGMDFALKNNNIAVSSLGWSDGRDGSAAHRTALSHPWGRCWAKWWVQYDIHQTCARFSLTVGYSEPQTQDLFLQLQDPIEIVLPIEAGLISIPNAALKGVSQRIVGGNQITTFLPAGTTIAHGQAHGWQGVFMAPQLCLQENRQLLAVATNWNDCGIGPLEQQVSYPAWMPDHISVRVATERKIINRPIRRDPYYEPVFGLGKTSAEAGAQDDFGTIHSNAGFLGCPEWLELAMPDALQEWCRPTHFREADGSPVRSAAHPQLNMWMGRPHRMLNVSPDQLGKPYEDSWDGLGLRAGYENATHGWRGMDPQHTSLLLLTTTAMLTGDYQLFDLLDDYAETYLASYTLPSTHPQHFSSTMDASRAVGRCGYTTSWLDLLLDRSDVRARVAARIRQVVLPNWTATAGKAVRPLDRPNRVNLTKYLDGNGTPLPTQPPEWHPWQEGIAVYGLLCIHAVTGEPLALEIAQGIGETFALWGWEDRGTYWQIGKAIEWTGDPVATGGTDTRKYLPGDGTDYASWNLAALQWLFLFSLNVDVRARCGSILAGIHEQRPNDGWFSIFARNSLR